MNVPKIDVDFLRGKLDIDDTNINLELSTYPSYYYSVLQAANFYESDFDRIEALTDLMVRDEARDAGEKVTEKIVESRVKSNPDYQQAYALRNEARALREAFKAKGNMLIQLATNMREELKSLNHSINAENAGVYAD